MTGMPSAPQPSPAPLPEVGAADIVPDAATAADPPRHEETIGDRDLRDWRSRSGRRLLRMFATLVVRGERIWRGWSLHLTVLAILLVGGALATAVAEAAADVYEAGRMANPVLSASVLFPDTGGEANQIGFGLAQDFTDVLLLRSRSRLADGEYARARELIGAKALALAADTEAAHVRVVGSWQLIAMREAVSAELAARFHAAGNIGRLELALQQAAASEAKLDVLQARAELHAARSALNRLMGLAPTEDRWRVVDRLPVPLAADDAVAELLRHADANRLDLAAARREVALLAEALGVTQSFRLLGDVELGVTTERETDRSRLTGPTLGLELPLFDHGHGRVARPDRRCG